LDLLEDWDFLIRLSKRNPFLRVPRVTSEFRFRVGDRIENSILARRDEIIDVTGLVYKRHPVELDELEDRRREFIRELKRQAEDLANIRASSGAGAALDIA